MEFAENTKLFLLFLLSRALNGFSRNLFTRLLFLLSLGAALCSVFSNNIYTDMVLFLGISLVLLLLTKRVSDNLIMILLTGHLSMSLRHPNEYRSIVYKNNKSQISDKLKSDFVKGLIEASKYREKLRFSTNKWFINNVLSDKDIQSIFKIKLKKKKRDSRMIEALSLFILSEVLLDKQYALKVLDRIVDSYYVTLLKK